MALLGAGGRVGEGRFLCASEGRYMAAWDPQPCVWQKGPLHTRAYSPHCLQPRVGEEVGLRPEGLLVGGTGMSGLPKRTANTS